MKHLLIWFVIITASACNTSKNNISEKPLANQTMSDSICSVSILFISIGAGTDWKTKKIVDDYILDYETKNQIKLENKSQKWGKEGEVDYCFTLNELSKSQQTLFVSELKRITALKPLVRLIENTSRPTRK